MCRSSGVLSRREYICSWIFIQVLGCPGHRARGPDLRIGGVWRRGRSPGCATGARNMSVGAPLGRDEALLVTPIAPECAPTGRRASVDAELLELVAQGAEGDAEGGGGLGLVVAVFLQGLLDGGAFDFLDVRGQGAAGGFARTQGARVGRGGWGAGVAGDRKSTRLNS